MKLLDIMTTREVQEAIRPLIGVGKFSVIQDEDKNEIIRGQIFWLRRNIWSVENVWAFSPSKIANIEGNVVTIFNSHAHQ